MAEVIWKHNQSGQSENWHKELKVGLGMEQMPCGEFEADAMSFAIGVLAYNSAQRLKRRALPDSCRTMAAADSPQRPVTGDLSAPPKPLRRSIPILGPDISIDRVYGDLVACGVIT